MPGLYDNDGRMRVTLGTASGDASASAPIPTQEAAATSGATTSVTSSAAPVTLRPATPARKSLIINNDSTAILYVLLGAGTASASNYTYQMAAKATVPAQITVTGFSGPITGLWASANGAAVMTELS